MFRRFITLALATLAFNAFAAVDVNKATQAELETVKGIGPGLSTKILDARKASAFKDWSDFVDRVPGIGSGNANKFSANGLTVGGQAYVAGSADSAKPSKGERRTSRKAAEPKPM
jgi:competence protein ComEA